MKKATVSVWRIMVHFGMHPDELLAIFLFMIFGRKMFAGIESAKIVEVTDDELAKLRHGRTEQQMRDEDHVISVGIGGGAFDEHGHDGKPRKVGTSAAQKVAEFLGVADDPTVVRLLDYVTKNDDKGGRTEWDFAQMVCDLNRSTFKGKPQDLYAWAEVVFESKRVRQAEYLAAEKIAETVQPTRVRDGIMAIRLDLTGRDDNAMVHSLLLKKADVVVIKRPTGHIQIYSRKGQVDLERVVNGIRYGELRARNLSVPQEVDLGQDGTLDCVPNWHYHSGAGWVFNGSLSHPGHQPTVLSLDYVCEQVGNRTARVQRVKNEQRLPFGQPVLSERNVVVA